MKGIILAGGSGTRLFPTTMAVSKQLLPVYDKPTIYYPLSTLMISGIRDIMIISTERDVPMIRSLLKDGSHLGLNIQYAVQAKPEGIAQAFIIAKDFIANDSVCLILGDNIFYGETMSALLKEATALQSGAYVFAYQVNDPERYGVVEFDTHGKAMSIEEKPQKPRSSWAVTGLYFYDRSVSERVATLKPSKRGELEITDLNVLYLNDKKLNVLTLGRGVAWLDTGTDDSLLDSAQFVHTIEKRQGLKVACLEEIALQQGYITQEMFVSLAENAPMSGYGQYLKKIAVRLTER
ncbi:MAG: glucose-1-phosphate thymidylyltransferase RfbA [Bdellovibrionaceae bacterium]|nr:glucose-1-phosphate thymidylyltransferase RfbA [Pseudobdellovibrionaceae bacterium]